MKRPSVLFSAAGASLGLVMAVGLAPAANAVEYGPDPTQRSIEALRGPFAVTSDSVSGLATSGFGSATIHYPTDSSKKYGVVAVSPGFTAGESSISWLGPRIASQGFIVITFNTQTRLDQPGQRGDQLLAALDHVTNRASLTVRNRADSSRQAVMGHSMGGGGTLEAAKKRRSIKATVGLTPWNLDKTWPEISSPSLIIGAQNDSVASVASHSLPFYNNIPNSTPKAYLELAGASHFAPNLSNTQIAWSSIAWLKTFVDGDNRYRKFVCPNPGSRSGLSRYQTNCR